jgi:hypothetical protein
MQLTTEVELLRREKTFIKWLKPTKRLLTSSGNLTTKFHIEKASFTEAFLLPDFELIIHKKYIKP